MNFSPALSELTSAGVATVPPVTIVYTTPTAAPTAQAATATAIGKIGRRLKRINLWTTSCRFHLNGPKRWMSFYSMSKING